MSLVSVEHLEQHFSVKEGVVFDREVARVHAVDDVSFELGEGETLGLVGESGCGKTTLARSIMRLLEPTGGKIEFDGHDITHASAREMRPLRRELQMVFQDPFASLNPRKRVTQIVGQPLRLHGVAKDEVPARVEGLLGQVGLQAEHVNRYPHEFSGGQRQRIGIARALALEPRLIVLDEPVSALDVSVQAQVLNLLQDLQAEFKLSYIFISHDLAVVKYISDQVMVMNEGEIVEIANSDEIYRHPREAYTKRLLASIPKGWHGDHARAGD